MQAMKADVIIGIDPDVEKSGFATLETSTGKVWCAAYDFPTMYGSIMAHAEDASINGKSITVVIEAGWKNATNWHVSTKDTPWLAAKKGLAVGRNQQVGKILSELLRAEGIDVVEKIPLRKYWRGTDKKISHDEIVRLMNLQTKRTNQEMRDAALLAWTEAGCPRKTDL